MSASSCGRLIGPLKQNYLEMDVIVLISLNVYFLISIKYASEYVIARGTLATLWHLLVIYKKDSHIVPNVKNAVTKICAMCTQ